MPIENDFPFLTEKGHIVSLVGGGGKTTLMYAMAAHCVRKNWHVLVTTTTHKTLRGPRGGVILCKEEHAKKIDKAIFPGSQGGPLMHIITAKAVAFGEAMKPEFKTYQEQVLKNAKVLAESLMDAGFQLVSGGTDNHLMLVDLTTYDLTGKAVEKMLDEAHITLPSLPECYEAHR